MKPRASAFIEYRQEIARQRSRQPETAQTYNTSSLRLTVPSQLVRGGSGVPRAGMLQVKVLQPGRCRGVDGHSVFCEQYYYR